MAGLKTFFFYLQENKVINDNPMTRIKIQRISASETKQGTNEMKWLTHQEQDRFLSYVDHEFKRLRNMAIIDVMLYAGLRVAEVEALKIHDLTVNDNVTMSAPGK